MNQSFLLRNLKRALVFGILPFKNFALEDSIIVCSEPRSGSTWLVEMLHELHKSTLLWEPIHPKWGVLDKDIKWKWRLSPDQIEDQDQWKDSFEKILRAKKFTRWTSFHCRAVQVRNANFLIHKFIRANLLLPWLIEHFPLKQKPILLLRHPIDTCQSQLKTFDVDDNVFTDELPASLAAEVNQVERDWINALDNRLHFLIALWCLMHRKLAKDLKQIEDVIVVHYENLLLDGPREISQLLSALNMDEQQNRLLSKLDWDKASLSNFKGDLKSDNEAQAWKNIGKLSSKESDQIQEIFDRFSQRMYRAKSPFPQSPFGS